MIKRRYKQIAKIFKWHDDKLKNHAFVVINQWLSLRKKYRFPESCYGEQVNVGGLLAAMIVSTKPCASANLSRWLLKSLISMRGSVEANMIEHWQAMLAGILFCAPACAVLLCWAWRNRK